MEIHNYDSTTNRLLPCLFCGSTPIWHLKGNGFTRTQEIVIKCPQCRIQRTDAIVNGYDHTIEWLEKQGEWKPAEWSEEDINNLNRIIEILVEASRVQNWWRTERLISKDEMEKLTNWLKLCIYQK